MEKKIRILKTLLLCFFLLVLTLLAQQDKTVPPAQDKNIQPPPKANEVQIQKETQEAPDKSQSPQKPEINYEKMFAESQRNFDRSLNTLDCIATLMGVLVGLITLITIIGIAFGFLEIKRWIRIRQDAQRYAEGIKKVHAQATYMAKDIEEIQPASMTAEPSKEYKEKLEEIGRKLDLLEALGTILKPEDYLARARDFYYREKYPLAITAANKAIELRPHYSQAWSIKGNILDRLGRHQEAIEDYTKVLELKPDDADAWNNMGVVLSQLGRHQEALEAYTKALERRPGDAQVWNNMGSVLGKLGRHQEALEANAKAIELRPDDVDVWNVKGIILGKLGRHQEALEANAKALELRPDDASSWYNKSCIHSLMRDKNESLKSLQKAIQLDLEGRSRAKADEDFQWLWEDEDFKRITAR